MDKINELLSLNLKGADIALIGTWIWITNTVKEQKELLKSAKCRWHSKRKCWYFTEQKGKTRYNAKASLSDLAEAYGYQGFKNENQQAALN